MTANLFDFFEGGFYGVRGGVFPVSNFGHPLPDNHHASGQRDPRGNSPQFIVSLIVVLFCLDATAKQLCHLGQQAFGLEQCEVLWQCRVCAMSIAIGVGKYA